ncbi:MAG: CoA protein activase [Desulfitobacteriaceae bacterium]|nr:CoA protein activase [Desulfitobacteriaceae bacterium]MDD4347004.1 CoA protein activase [Desulfitobacteriaceae bacterium]MDD4401725.1 CoA protein activase [Desulfitobacteriaceae bacterium]
MRKVTFPHMGTSVFIFSDLIRDLGNEPIVPLQPNKKILDLGVRYAPEFACLPFKVLLGSYLEAMERGAEVVVTSGGNGPCRAGHYGEVAQKILDSNGYKIEILVFDSVFRNPFQFIRKLNYLNKAKLSYWSIAQLIRFYWRKLQALDKLERCTHKVRPRALNKGITTKVFKQGIEWIQQSRNLGEIEEAEQQGLLALKNIPQDPDRMIIRIGIVGEIYVLLEPAVNHEIEEILGNLGAEVDRSIYLSGWAHDNTFGHKKDSLHYARPYLGTAIGGHAQEGIGHTIMYAQNGFDGVIQLAPFTCIPEIVVKTIAPRITKDYGIPILTFFLDEQTGRAGMQTRLEAFTDMLKRKKRQPLKVVGGEKYARVFGN